MQRNAKSLTGFAVGATDGEFGKVDEFYFDDETWTIRYLIVKTGGWLSGRRVLISPSALQKPDWENETLPVNLTKEQIKNSPDIDTDKPVSRQQELDLYTHYSWPYEGGTTGAGFYGGMGMMGMVSPNIPFEEKIAEKNFDQNAGDPHLRSTKDVEGYQIHATDDKIGDVEDFIIDDETWKVRFLVVDTGNWLPGKKVLISPQWIKDVEWAESAVYVNVTADKVKNSPEYDSSKPVQDNYTTDLFNHYGRFIND